MKLLQSSCKGKFSFRLFAGIIFAGTIAFPIQAATPAFQPIPPLFFVKPFAGADPLPQILTVASNGTAFDFGVTASTSSGGSWLSVSPSNASTIAFQTPNTFRVIVTTSPTLAVGTYTGQLVFNSAIPSSMTVPVTLVVAAAGSTYFDNTPGQMGFFMKTSGSAPPGQDIQIRNGGSGSLNWTLTPSTADGGAWLHASSTSGTAPSIVNITITPPNLPGAGLVAGSFDGQLLFQSSGGSTTVPVTVVVGANVFNQINPLSFTKPFTGADPLPQNLIIDSTGTGNFDFGATAVSATGGNWLSVTPTNPSTIAYATAQTFSVVVSTSPTMPAGTYTGQVLFNQGSFAMAVPVTLTVASGVPFFDNVPGQMSFSLKTGGSGPPGQDIEIRNAGTGTLNWTLTPTTADGGNWLNVSSTSGTAPSIVTAGISVANLPGAGLIAGTFSGQLLFRSPTSSVTVSVSVVVGPSVFNQINALSFTKPFAGADPLPQTVVVASTGSNFDFGATAVTATGGNWLSVSPTNPSTIAFATPHTFSISVNTSPTLPAGTYTGQVYFNGGNASLTVPVTLTVGSGTAFFDNVPGQMSFSLKTGGSAPAAQDIEIRNAGTGTLNWTVTPTTADGGNWLNVSSTSGTAPSIVTASISVANLPGAGLVAGAFNGNLLFRSPSGSSVTVAVTVTVGANVFNQINAIAFTKPFGGADPLPQTLVVASTGTNFDFGATATTATGGNWLSVSPSNPSTIAFATPQTAIITVTTSPTMPAGTYTGQVVFNGGNASITVPVTLTVAQNTAFFDNVPGQMSFSMVTRGNAPPSQPVQIRNGGSGSLNWTLTARTADGGNWLNPSTTSGTAPSTVNVQIVPQSLPGSGLIAGTFTGNLLLRSPGDSVTVPVTVVVGANVFNQVNGLSFTMPFGGANPLPQVITADSTGTNFDLGATASTATGGSWLSVSPTNPSTIAFATPQVFIVTVNASPTMAAGTYTGEVILNHGNFSMTVPVTLNVVPPTGSFFDNIQGQMSFSMTTAGATPPAQNVRIRNGGASVGTLSWTASASTADGGNWINLSAASGTDPATVAVSITPQNLPGQGLIAGLFNGQILFQSASSSVTVPVSVQVGANVFNQLPEVLFNGTTGSNPLPQTITVSSTGAAFDFGAVANSGKGGAWLKISPTNPSTIAFATPTVFTVSATSATLPGGSYTGQLVFNHGNSAMTVPVILSLPSTLPVLTISKTHNGSFSQGQANATYTVTVANQVGAGAATGTITVTDVVPTGLTIVSMSGTGWTCSGNSCTRNDGLLGGTAYPSITVTVSVAANAPATVTNQATVSGGGSASAAANDPTTISQITNAPALSITKAHNGNFVQGQQNAAYTIIVSNQVNAGPTSSAVAVTDTVPSGLTLVSMSGTGWNCSGATCTRTDSLPGAGIYPGIIATFNVSASAAASVTNQATVSGGGSASATASDPTTITTPLAPALSISKTHAGNFVQGQTNATYTLTVSNPANAGTTSGAVTVTEAAPAGLTLVSMTGTGWSCSGATCTRSDALAGGGAYPPITVTVNVAASAASSVTNQATVSGGGSASATASDPTTIVQGSTACQLTASGGSTINLTNVVPNPPTVPVSQQATIQVTPGANCTAQNTWVATSGSYWVQILSGGTGNGGSGSSISIQGLSNTLSVPRSIAVTITPSGPNAGAPTTVTVNEPGSPAPLLYRQVTALYQTILGRDPDPLGYAFWTGQGTAGLGVMVDDFTTSPEGFGTNFSVVAAYQAALGRPATIAEFTTAVGNLRNGSAPVATLLSSLNPALTTAQVYQNLLNRAPTAAEAAAPPATAFSTIINSAEFQNTGSFATAADHSNSLYVEMLYYIILTRALDGAGFNFWVGVANSGGSGIFFNGPATFPTRFQILGPGAPNQGFVGSPEFQSHF